MKCKEEATKGVFLAWLSRRLFFYSLLPLGVERKTLKFWGKERKEDCFLLELKHKSLPVLLGRLSRKNHLGN